jgi:hypothetical protein
VLIRKNPTALNIRVIRVIRGLKNNRGLIRVIRKNPQDLIRGLKKNRGLKKKSWIRKNRG